MIILVLSLAWVLLAFGIPVSFHWPLGAHMAFILNLSLWSAVAGGLVWGMAASPRSSVARTGMVLFFGSLLLGVCAWLGGTVPLRAADYHKLSGGVDPREVGLEFLQRPDDLLRVSTRSMAWQVANKALGGEISLDGRTVQLTSQFEIDADRGTLLRLDDSSHRGLYWIFVLDYSGLFASWDLPWVPGYVLLSATDPQARAELVTDRQFRYTPNAFFTRNLSHHVYWAHPDLEAEESHLELDDAGRAWWITSYSSPKVAWGGYDLSHVSLTDPETGTETFVTWDQWLERRAEYAWVDRVVPETIAARRLDRWWSLAGGWLNSLGLPGTNVLQRTPYSGNELWFLPLADRSVWLSGITSMNNKDYSLVNFSTIDTRTGTLAYVKVRGTEEDGAVRMTQGALGADASIWRPVLPTPVVLDGRAWWTLMVVDNQDLFRAVALLPLDSTNEVYFGSSFADAKEKAGQGPALTGDAESEPLVTLTLTAEEVYLLRQILKKLEAQP